MRLLLLQYIPRYKMDIPFLVTFTPELSIKSVVVPPLNPRQVIIPPTYADRQRLVPALPKRGVLQDLDYCEHVNSPLATQIKRYVKDALYFNYVDRHNQEMARVQQSKPKIHKPTPRPAVKRKQVDKDDFSYDAKRFYKDIQTLQVELRSKNVAAVTMMSLMLRGFINMLMLNSVFRSLFSRLNVIPEPQNENRASLPNPFKTKPSLLQA
jgi:hypothetical protein